MSAAFLALVLAPLLAFPPQGILEARDVGGLETRAAALILSGQNGGDLPIAADAVPVGATADGVRLVAVVDVGADHGPGTVADESPRLFEVYAYVLSGGGEVVAFVAQGFALTAAEQGGRTVKLFADLELAPGEYALRLLVRRRPDDRFALRDQALVVPAWEEGRELPPLAALDPEAWLVARVAGRELPFLVDAEPAAPAPLQPLGVDSVASLAEKAQEEAGSPDLPFVTRGRTPGRARLQASYAELLRRLVAGDPDAVPAIVALEHVALGQGGRQTQLEDVEGHLLELAEDLRARHEGSLLPLIVLYDGIYRERHASKDYLHATHARRMLTSLIAFHTGRGASKKARREAAQALASLGAYILEQGSALTSKQPFERALALDPEQQVALHTLAVLQEARGKYLEAVALLRRLAKLSPNDVEVRLRLAVNLERLESKKEAAERYRECLEAGTPWVAAVAHQELARHLSGSGKYEAAALVLRQAVERWPEIQRFPLQLAAVLDAAGRPAEAQAALAALDPGRGRQLDSPRMRYSRWPVVTVESLREELAEAARSEGRAALQAALEAL